MTLRDDAVEPFLALFDRVSARIRSSPGCRGLVLLRDVHHPTVVTTYSMWDSETDLQAYRTGALFQETWTETRSLFSAPAEAWSHELLRDDPAAGPVKTTR